jgi:carbon-monoxide dehydrogenase medium subunit
VLAQSTIPSNNDCYAAFLLAERACAIVQRMQAFSYVPARTLEEATAVLAKEGDKARLLSGGTDILVMLREGRRKASVVVDVKGIPQLNELSYDPKRGLTIGAAVPCHKIYGHAAIANAYPGLIDSVSLIGGVAIQGRATLGGNIGTASPAGDSLPMLIALEAVCLVARGGIRKEVPIEKMFVGPGKTILQPDEILVQIMIPAPARNSGAAYLRFIPRNEMDIAVTSAGVNVVLSEDKGTFTKARIALGAVAPTPLFVPEAGAALVGKPVNEASIEVAARAAQAAARPISDMRGSAEQRKQLAYVMTKRALAQAVERAK